MFPSEFQNTKPWIQGKRSLNAMIWKTVMNSMSSICVIPDPMRCFKCQKFGHNQINCQLEVKCSKCAKPDHRDQDSQDTAHCASCNGYHPSISKPCPIWIKEKAIQKVKCTQSISFKEACRLVEDGISPKPQKTFAAAARKVTQVNLASCTKTEVT